MAKKVEAAGTWQYRVKDWAYHFESAKSKTYKHKRQCYMPCKNGLGYRALIRRERGPALFGAWVAMIQMLSRAESRHGYLTDTTVSVGVPIGPAEISMATDVPEAVIKEMLEITSSKTVGWLEVNPATDTTGIPQGYHEDTTGIPQSLYPLPLPLPLPSPSPPPGIPRGYQTESQDEPSPKDPDVDRPGEGVWGELEEKITKPKSDYFRATFPEAKLLKSWEWTKAQAAAGKMTGSYMACLEWALKNDKEHMPPVPDEEYKSKRRCPFCRYGDPIEGSPAPCVRCDGHGMIQAITNAEYKVLREEAVGYLGKYGTYIPPAPDVLPAPEIPPAIAKLNKTKKPQLPELV